jgi:hypothetical protein
VNTKEDESSRSKEPMGRSKTGEDEGIEGMVLIVIASQWHSGASLINF